MPNYTIDVNYNKSTERPKTSPQHTNIPQQKIIAEHSETKETISTRHSLSGLKVAGIGLGVASKINQYVGELTENTITQRRNAVGLTFAGLFLATVSNPVLGLIATATYTANAGIQYGIRNYKENLSSAYLRQLSGGTVNTGR